MYIKYLRFLRFFNICFGCVGDQAPTPQKTSKWWLPLSPFTMEVKYLEDHPNLGKWLITMFNICIRPPKTDQVSTVIP